MPRKKKDEEVAKKTAQVGLVEWKNSNGKKLLKKELWDVSSRYHSMSIKDIHVSDERFSAYPLKNFSANVLHYLDVLAKEAGEDRGRQLETIDNLIESLESISNTISHNVATGQVEEAHEEESTES